MTHMHHLLHTRCFFFIKQHVLQYRSAVHYVVEPSMLTTEAVLGPLSTRHFFRRLCYPLDTRECAGETMRSEAKSLEALAS